MPIREYKCPHCGRVEERIELAGETFYGPPWCYDPHFSGERGEVNEGAVQMKRIISRSDFTFWGNFD